MKIALAQIDVRPGRPAENAAAMLEFIRRAKADRAHLVIFPELCVTGYLIGDGWEESAFLTDALAANEAVITASDGIAVMFGSVAIDPAKKNNDGRVRKYNAFFTAQNGRLVRATEDIYPYAVKTLLPNYREFDDTRYFFSQQKLAAELDVPAADLLHPLTVELDGRQYAVGRLLCEDGWSDDYALDVIDILTKKGPLDLIINLSASPYTLGKNQKRHRVFAAAAQNAAAPLIYVNNVGLQNNGKTIYTFDGSSTVYDRTGDIALEAEPYAEDIYYVDIVPDDNGNAPLAVAAPPAHTAAKPSPAAEKTAQPGDDTAAIYRALSYGVKHFLADIGVSRVVIGISGGVDSAVAAALYASILPPDDLLLVNLPGKFNSATTKDLAAQLAENIGCRYGVFPIQAVVDLTVTELENTPIRNADGTTTNLAVSDFVRENIQARDRSARLLAGIAAAFGGVFTCNANKAETTVGYSTLYGDQSGFLAALADLWKYQIYDLARYLNDVVYQREVIPRGTIEIVPSAELSAAQNVDAGQGDPLRYDYHDFLFRSFVERWTKAAPADLLKWYAAGTIDREIGCPPGLTKKYFPTCREFIDDLEHWWKCYRGLAIAKRIQAPPIIAVSRRAFGFDHRESQLGVYFTREYLELKRRLLAE